MIEYEHFEKSIEELVKERVQANRYGCTARADENLDWYTKGLKDAGMTDEQVKQVRGLYYSISMKRILKEEKQELENTEKGVKKN
jgi:hypothetical protein